MNVSTLRRPTVDHVIDLGQTEVLDNIFLGSSFFEPPMALDLGVITLYEDAPFADQPWVTEEFRMATFHDSPFIPLDAEILRWNVNEAARMWDSGKSLFFRCQAGINRSALVLGIFLREVFEMDGQEAIALMREQRSKWVLCNTYFEDYVRHWPDDPMADPSLRHWSS